MAKSKFDEGRRKRTLGAALFGSSAVFALGVSSYVLQYRHFDPEWKNLGVNLVGFAALIAVIAIGWALFRLIQLNDLKKVHRANPDVLIFAASSSDSFKRALKGPAAAERTTLGSFPGSFAVVVDPRGIGLWGGSAEPEVKYFIHWVDIVAVVPTEVDAPGLQQTGLAIDAKFGETVIPLEVVIMRRPHGFFHRAEFETLQRLAAEVEARRPAVVVA